MAVTSTQTVDWKQRFVAELKRDKKKATLLALLALVCLVVGIRAAAKMSSAGAAPPPAPAETPEHAGGADLLSLAARIEDRPGGPSRLDGWVSKRPADGSVVRDLFVGSMEGYAKAEKATRDKRDTGPTAAEAEMLREKKIRARAAGLKLQSTMLGSHPAAIINSKLVRAGEFIDGFRVVEIQAKYCLLECDGVPVRLGTGSMD